MHDGIFKEESWAKLERPERIKGLNPTETLVALGLKRGDRFVDFGSGTGVFVVPALELVGELGCVYAVERSQVLIDRMLEKFQVVPRALKISKQDLMHLEWQDERVEWGLLSHVAHELPDLVQFLKLASSAFIPGGKIGIIEWCAKEQPQGPPLHKRISRLGKVNQANRGNRVGNKFEDRHEAN